LAALHKFTLAVFRAVAQLWPVRLLDNVMGVCCAFIRLSDRNIETLVRQPGLVYTLLDFPEVPPQPSDGFFARLFGLTKPTPPPAEPLTLPDSREEDDLGDVDKAWQAIHYLLTGTARQTDSLLGFLDSGGITIEGTDVGYGPPRAYTSDKVASLFTELSGIDREMLRRRYKPKEMDKQGVYPKIWARDGDRGYDYIWHHFERLRALLAEAHKRNQGLFVYYT
jgi:hypothetical protein